MQEMDEQFYKYPRMLMVADAYVSRETGEFVRLTDADKNIYVVMKARNEFFENHYDKQSDIAMMCNVTLRTAGDSIRNFMRHGIIEATVVHSGGKHKNLKYTKVLCLELLKKAPHDDKTRKNAELVALGKIPESLWKKAGKKGGPRGSHVQVENWLEERDPF